MLGQFCTGTTNADLVGIEIKLAEAYVPKAGLLGYDVIDGECSISIITNWGTDKENLINPYLMSNGLIGNLPQALHICDLLRQTFPNDPHVKECEVWAVYSVDDQAECLCLC